MKTTTHLLALATACAAALFAVAEDAESAPAAEEKKAVAEVAPSSDENKDSNKSSGDEGFARYQSIIDRQPFGPPPPGFDPSLPVGQAGAGGANGVEGKTEAEISAEEQKLMSSVRVSILNVTPAGVVMAGFTDSTTQPPVNYYLKVGDTSTDAAKWTVKEADPAVGTVTLSKDGIDVTLAVGGETKKGSSAKSATQGGRSLAAAGGLRGGRGIFPGRGLGSAPGLGRPPGFGPPPLSGGEGTENAQDGGGALARLRQRRMLKREEEAAQKRAAENERAAKEEKEKEERAREREQLAAEREQQREALLQIQEELRRQREAKAAQKAEAEESNEEQPE
jgi:hypothetical protein